MHTANPPPDSNRAVNPTGAWLLAVALGAGASGCRDAAEPAGSSSDGSTSAATAGEVTPDEGEGSGDGTSTGDSEVELPGTDSCRPPARRMWQLSPTQLALVYERIAGADALALKNRFELYATVGAPYTSRADILNASSLFATELVDAVSGVATALVADPGDRLPPCAAEPWDEACASEVITALGEAAFRRPVPAERHDELLEFFVEQREQFGAELAPVSLVRRVLGAPEVLFRSEWGEDDGGGLAPLTAHELADMLAFTLTDAPPDEALRADAASGALADPEVLREHAERLLASPPPLEHIVAATSKEPPSRLTGLMRFVSEWLDVDDTRLALPEASSHAGHNDERILRWLANEMYEVARYVLWEDVGRLETLLTVDYSFYGNTLADYYERARPSEDERHQPFPKEQGRIGLLMQGGFLTGHGTTTDRGAFVRERMFCQQIDPPDDADMNLEDLEAEAEQEAGQPLSPREVRALHMEDPGCAACHELLDPLGFPMDAFDDLGQPRDEWDGFPIDTHGEIVATEATNGTVSNAAELVEALAASVDVQDCFVAQLYAYVHGRPPGEEDRCYLERLQAQFSESGGDVRALLVEMVAGEESRTRTVRGE